MPIAPWSPYLSMLTERFEQALVFATRLHSDQRRKSSGAPYLSHLLAVTAIVLEHGGDEDAAIAALLHDAVEDQGGPPTRAEIARRFGERLATLVDGCTDTDQHPKPPWRARKEAYVERLAHEPAEVRLISAADKLHNLRDLTAALRGQGNAVWGEFRGGREGTLWYHQAVLAALQGGVPLGLWRQLEQAVAELQMLAIEDAGAPD